MKRRTLLQSIPAAALLGATASATIKSRKLERSWVYEFRVYHANEGKLDDLLARFRNHTMRIFDKHGMLNVAYWTPIDDPLKGRTLFYVIAHKSREQAVENWKAFEADPEWQRVKAESEAHGKLVNKVDSTFLTLTDFSPPLSAR